MPGPPTYSPWVRCENIRKRMIWMVINGGPGRITAYFPVGCQRLTSFMKNRSIRFFRTFDLPIMRPAERDAKPTETTLCRRLVGKPIPVSLPLVRSKYAFTRVHFSNLGLISNSSF